VEAGVHLPQVDLTGTGLTSERLLRVAGHARAHGFAAVSANDHFRFARPWLDGLVALSLVAPHVGTPTAPSSPPSDVPTPDVPYSRLELS
jgi:hypothetical protein